MSQALKPIGAGALLVFLYLLYLAYSTYTNAVFVEGRNKCQSTISAASKGVQTNTKDLDAAVARCMANTKADLAAVPVIK